MVDVVYGILAHESVECVLDMIRNVKHFNRTMSLRVVINASPAIYEELLARKDPDVRVLPDPWNRAIGGYDILEAIVQIGEYCRRMGISGKYFVPLASNCMFWNHTTLDTIEQLYTSESTDRVVDIHSRTTQDWHWPRIYKNTRMLDEFSRLGVVKLIGKQWEGSIYEFDIFVKLCECLRDNNFRNLVQEETFFEEYLLPTLYVHLIGRSPMQLCHVFWGIPDYRPSIAEIEASREPCVKRVFRDLQDPVRVWLRSKTNGYSPLA